MKLEEPTSASSNEDRDLPIASAVRALPAGARLDEFEIEGIISEGNVAIVYAATDRALEAPVAIAEYMPAGLARRHGEAKVMPRTSAQADAFEKGLKAFIKETRTLARCDHPSLVRIVRLCEVNSTAYRVMPRYPSRRLLDVRQSMSEPPDEEALRALLDALLGALAAYHGMSRQGHAVEYFDSGRQPSAPASPRCSGPGDRQRSERRTDDGGGTLLRADRADGRT